MWWTEDQNSKGPRCSAWYGPGGKGTEAPYYLFLDRRKGRTLRSAPFAAQSQAGLAAGDSARGDRVPREAGAMISTEG